MSDATETERSVIEALQADAEDLGRARGRQHMTDQLYASETTTRVAQLAFEKETGRSWMNLSVTDQETWRSSAEMWIAVVGQALAEAHSIDDDEAEEG